MLWFAGFMGLFAAGTVAMVDFTGKVDPSDEEPVVEEQDAPFLLTADLLSAPEQDGADASIHAETKATQDPASEFFARPAPDEEDDYIEDLEGIVAVTDETDPDLTDSAPIYFDPAQHDLIVVWDDGLGEAPMIDLTPSEEVEGVTNLSFDNEHLAQVKSDIDVTPHHIAMIPLSTAHALGWADA